MNIALIGYRAAGKSTLGQLLAQRLGWPCLDIDRGIEERSGKSIKTLYEEDGDLAYRDVESKVVATACQRDQCVIAFGAGSLMRSQNRTRARSNSMVIYLKLPASVLWDRIRADPGTAETRPNLSSGGLKEVQEMLELRAPVYRECANHILDGSRPPEQLAAEVLVALERSGARPPDGENQCQK